MKVFLYPGMVVHAHGSKEHGVVLASTAPYVNVLYRIHGKVYQGVWGGDFNLCLTPEETAEEWKDDPPCTPA